MTVRLLNDIEKEVTELLSKLISLDTTNPPGNETVAAEYLARVLEEDEFSCEVLEPATGRGSMITRLKGKDEAPSLLLLSHLDVVAADPKEWSVDPFSGVIKDGFVWGRGALDMKFLTAIEVIVMKLLKRNNVKLKGDVILAATADEEAGGRAGVHWLLHNHPEKIKTDYAINEGGGFGIPISNKLLFTVQNAEKGVVWLKIKARGRPGHGSIPSAADNAVLRMADVAHRLGTYRSKVHVTTTAKRFIEGLVRARKSVIPRQLLSSIMTNPLLADRILDRLAKKQPGMAELIRAMLRTTIAPTILHGGVKTNVIPSNCEGTFDCRILPGQTKEMLLEEIKTVLQGIELEKLVFAFDKADKPSESPLDTPFYREIENVLKEFEPRCNVVPFMQTGGTDSRFLRAVGCVCYGFSPIKVDMPVDDFVKLAHGIDERISIENLVYGTSVLYTLIKRFMS
ncbi:MAG: M20/M25/M40 family metallo-hydrolase [Candidatus Bathyarchaeota archaeon]|jgi:acetylornithine deacetylase/succinyl-diaminopimelate desuccinylase-like protein